MTSSYSFTPPTDDFVLTVQRGATNQGIILSHALAYQVAGFITALSKTTPAGGVHLEAWLRVLYEAVAEDGLLALEPMETIYLKGT